MIIASAGRLKNSSFGQANFTQTLCIWTEHVFNKFNVGFVISTTRGECATHLKCSPIFHTCLQRNINLCGGGEFGDG